MTSMKWWNLSEIIKFKQVQSETKKTMYELLRKGLLHLKKEPHTFV